MDINTDPGCGRTMNLDMVPSSSLGSDVTMTPGGSAGHSGWHDPAGKWHLDTNTAPGGSPDLWHWHGFQWYQEPQTSTYILAAVESWTQIWLSATALAWMTPLFQVTMPATQMWP